MAAMIRTNITLDARTIGWLQMISTATGASKSEIVRRGVEAYMREMGRNLQRNLAQSLEEKGFKLDESGEIVDYTPPAVGKKKAARKRAATRKRA